MASSQIPDDEFSPGELDMLLKEGEQSGPPLDGEMVLAELKSLRESRHNEDDVLS